MNIYIPIEIKVRELESRLLLALEAASRGHDVILGDKASTINAAAKGKLKPGIVHDKSITPNKKKLERYSFFKQHNIFVTSQDEEAGLTHESYKQFLANRFSEKSLSLINRNYTWGIFDYNAITHKYFGYSDKILLTGSPRVDLWRSEFDDYYESDFLPGKQFKKQFGPYILIPSNFGAILSPNGFWHRIKIQRELGYYKTQSDEIRRYERAARQFRLISEFIALIRLLSEKLQEHQIVLRPHPAESIDNWRNAIGESFNNVHIIRKGSVNSWIKNADYVIHNSCTTGIEARASGSNVIAFIPDMDDNYSNIANKLSKTVSSAEEILDIIQKGLSPKYEITGEEILNNRLANYKNGLAYKQIVDDWESFDAPSLQVDNRLPEYSEKKSENSFIEKVKTRLKKSKTQNKKETAVNHKIPYLLPEEIQQIKDGLSTHNERFRNVSIRRIAAKGYFLNRS